MRQPTFADRIRAQQGEGTCDQYSYSILISKIKLAGRGVIRGDAESLCFLRFQDRPHLRGPSYGIVYNSAWNPYSPDALWWKLKGWSMPLMMLS